MMKMATNSIVCRQWTWRRRDLSAGSPTQSTPGPCRDVSRGSAVVRTVSRSAYDGRPATTDNKSCRFNFKFYSTFTNRDGPTVHWCFNCTLFSHSSAFRVDDYVSCSWRVTWNVSAFSLKLLTSSSRLRSYQKASTKLTVDAPEPSQTELGLMTAEVQLTSSQWDMQRIFILVLCCLFCRSFVKQSR